MYEYDIRRRQCQHDTMYSHLYNTHGFHHQASKKKIMLCYATLTFHSVPDRSIPYRWLSMRFALFPREIASHSPFSIRSIPSDKQFLARY